LLKKFHKVPRGGRKKKGGKIVSPRKKKKKSLKKGRRLTGPCGGSAQRKGACQERPVRGEKKGGSEEQLHILIAERGGDFPVRKKKWTEVKTVLTQQKEKGGFAVPRSRSLAPGLGERARQLHARKGSRRWEKGLRQGAGGCFYREG